jgi:HD-like signal output (HDOD) protein
MDEEIKKRIGDKIRDLPTLPSIAINIVKVTNDPDATVEELKNIISADQVVAGRILRAVNSAYYGFPRQIDTLSKAIVILGFNNVRSLTLSVSIMEMFPTKSPTEFDYRELWIHAVGTAHCARAIAKILNPRFAEQFFVAGLLHDIGIIALNQCFKSEFMQTAFEARAQKRPLFQAETEKFEFNHAEVSGFIADKWLFPEPLVQAAACHHSPMAESNHQQIVLAVHAADIICKIFSFGDYGDNEPFTMDSICEPAMAMLKISRKGIPDELLKAVRDELTEASDFINIFK